MLKKTALVTLVIIGIFVLYGLSKQIITALEAGKRLDKEALGLSALQQENYKLREKLSEVKTLDFVEEQLRNKLNQSKPNETIVIIPKSLLDQVMAGEKSTDGLKLPYWRGWLNLFL